MAAVAVVVGGRVGSTEWSGFFLQRTAATAGGGGGVATEVGVKGGAELGRKTEAVTDLGRFSS